MPLDPKTWREPIEAVSIDHLALAFAFFHNQSQTGLSFKTSKHWIYASKVHSMKRLYVPRERKGGGAMLIARYRFSGECSYRNHYENGPYWAYAGRFVATYDSDTGKGEFRFFQDNSWSGTDES